MDKIRIVIFFAVIMPILVACHHGIDKDALEYPPDLDDSGVATSDISKEEVAKELKALEAVPYPPYRMTEGDSFRVSIYNEPELGTINNTVVTPDGYIVLDLVGMIKVKDMTLAEASEAVKNAYKKFVKFPEIALIPNSIGGRKASLMGKVNQPDNYPVSENVRLSDFVACGRGFSSGEVNSDTVEMSDLSNSLMIRNGKILPVNFEEAIKKGNPLYNIRVFPKDIVYIASREDSRVVVMGQVKKPHVMNWRSNITVGEAIAYAGGLEEDYWSTALVLRHDKNGTGALKVYKINVDDVISGRMRDYRLASGDILYVPRDAMGEYNVFIRKLMPTAQLINALMSPPAYWLSN